MAVEFLADAAAIERRLTELNADAPVAPVGPDVPLLANLSALENLTLVGAFHRPLADGELEAEAVDRLRALGLAHCGHRRRPDMSAREAFGVQMARAAMRPGATVVIATPFALVPELESDAAIRQAVAALGLSGVRILDYPSNRGRYRDPDEGEP